MDQLNVDGARPAVARVAALPAAWTAETDRLVLLALACDSYDGDTARPGVDHLAAWTGLGRSTVYSVLLRLQSASEVRPALIEVAEATRGRRRTSYRLTLPDPEPSSTPDGSSSTTVQLSGRFDRPATVQQPSSPSDGWTPPTVRQPSSTPDPPSPSDTPTPTSQAPAVESSTVDELAELVVGELPIHLHPDSARLERCCARLAAEGWTPVALASWIARQRWPADGSPGLVVFRLEALNPDDRRRLSSRPGRARPDDARRCGHGQHGGMEVRGIGADASRVCSSCEIDTPADQVAAS